MELSQKLQQLRKERGLTQEELSEALYVSRTAVSKWESEMTMPDIMLLPSLADIFGIYIDELFSREIKAEKHYDNCAEFPWPDDSIIRGVVFEGRKILQFDTIEDRFTFEIKGEAKNVASQCSIEVNGNVSGGCSAKKNIIVSGAVSGGCSSCALVEIGGSLSGGCNSGGDITVQGSFSGGCNAGRHITCGGNLSGNINCAGGVTVKGNVEADKIKGNVVCNSLSCDKIEGHVTINKAE